MINNDIEITVLDIKGEQVKIGISAPKEVPVYRKEVYIQIQEANKEASANMEGMEQLASLFGGKSGSYMWNGTREKSSCKGLLFSLVLKGFVKPRSRG